MGSDSRVALALWVKDALKNSEATPTPYSQVNGFTAAAASTIPVTVPPTAASLEEIERLRGSIPQICFSELPGIELVSATVESPVQDFGYPAAPAAGPPSHGDLPPPGHLPGYAPHPVGAAAGTLKPSPNGVDPHWEIFANTQFPSASQCATCHQQIYDEWAISSHAYAAISPMFQKFEDKITRLAQGTVGYFCMRCHAPVATTMGFDRTASIWQAPEVYREGVTCVACHRVKTPYVKANGERRIEPGDIHNPVYGGSDGTGNAIAIKYRDFFKVRTDSNQPSPAQPIHQRAIQFEELSQATFCMSCHQVAVQPGIKLEVVWDQYRGSPACREGVSCQDCHMGRVPGRNEGYSVGPAAVVDGKVVNPERKHSNHTFYGPGYPITHPGLFPFENKPDRWSLESWQQFDWRSGWGSESFEQAVARGEIRPWFPPEWENVDDRMDARAKVDRNLKKILLKKELRIQLMENGSRVDGPFFSGDPRTGRDLSFEYVVTNTNNGHNMPSGSLGAQPQLWVNVALTGPDGTLLWESGHLDSYGDLADIHSIDVTSRRMPLDRQLVNFQTKFLITNVKGTDREMPLPVNIDFDQLPFLRPPAQPVTVINHPPFIRMEAHSIPPTGSKRAKYTVPACLLDQPGTYRLSLRLRSRAEPMYFMRFCETTPEMIRAMQEWTVDFHQQSVVFEIQP